jgi:hypothetical protein
MLGMKMLLEFRLGVDSLLIRGALAEFSFWTDGKHLSF